MPSKLNPWIPLVALVALAAVASVAGCTVEVVSSDGRDAGAAASADADAGRVDGEVEAATADAFADGGAADGSADGTALGDGAETSADASDAAATLDAAEGGDASACYADDPAVDGGDADAGLPACSTLPYSGQRCTETGDGGSMTVDAYGVRVCETFRAELKPSAFQALFACLSQNQTPAASCLHDRGDACMAQVFGRAACDVPAETFDGGAFGCAEVAASCPAGDAARGVTLQDCSRWLHPFNAVVRREVFNCYVDPINATVPCAERFEDYCVFPSDIRP